MEPRSFLNDPRHWRERAEEARSRADQISEPQSKNAMLRIAHDYEVLAERAEARASGHSLKSDCLTPVEGVRSCVRHIGHEQPIGHTLLEVPGSPPPSFAGIEDRHWVDR